MSYDVFCEIVQYTKELCKKRVPNHIYGIRDRNDWIVADVAKKFSISYELANEVFMYNNNSELLMEIYNEKFKTL